jgi:hypothetical protein
MDSRGCGTVPITVLLRAESGHVEGSIVEGNVELTRALPPFGDPDFPMLGLVDPYGDTIFNGLQMRSVIPEIQRLKKLTPNPPAVLDELEDLADLCANGIHLYLVFVGD